MLNIRDNIGKKGRWQNDGRVYEVKVIDVRGDVVPYSPRKDLVSPVLVYLVEIIMCDGEPYNEKPGKIEIPTSSVELI